MQSGITVKDRCGVNPNKGSGEPNGSLHIIPELVEKQTNTSIFPEV
jgi:hypothetical protein